MGIDEQEEAMSKLLADMKNRQRSMLRSEEARCYALAITKLEEALLWYRESKNQAI